MCAARSSTSSGRLFLADLVAGTARELSAPGAVDDPRLDPDRASASRSSSTGRSTSARSRAASASWHRRRRPGCVLGARGVRGRRGDGAACAATGGRPTVRRWLAARVDERPVRIWHIADQTDPAGAPRAVRYPQAGTGRRDRHAARARRRDGRRHAGVEWDAAAFPYVGRVGWSEAIAAHAARADAGPADREPPGGRPGERARPRSCRSRRISDGSSSSRTRRFACPTGGLWTSSPIPRPTPTS